jgi:hypothetical protein
MKIKTGIRLKRSRLKAATVTCSPIRCPKLSKMKGLHFVILLAGTGRTLKEKDHELH